MLATVQSPNSKLQRSIDAAEGFLWVVMPVGFTHGWGVCGKYLALEMSRLIEVKFVTEHMETPDKYDDPDDRLLSEIFLPLDEISEPFSPQGEYRFNHPVLQAIEGSNLRPWFVRGNAPRVIGYTFFEKTSLEEENVAAAQRYFDWVVAGSSWCEQILNESGITRTKTILQGIDTGKFHSGYAEKERLKDCFVVFSGGKMEFRKGQDLVIRAFKVLQDKYDDVLLVNCWYNRWDSAMASMSMSSHIRFEMPKGSYVDAVNHLLKVNGISPDKAIVLEPVSHSQIAEVYRDTDCGVFPNRCEGGTNLVLMEYMACGKPVIASNNSGHKDILSTGHCILLENQVPLNIAGKDGSIRKRWCEPNLDEIVSKLEWAYNNREEIKNIGHAGSKFISQLTWEKAAKEFYDLLFPDR